MRIRESLFALLRDVILRDNLSGWQIARACNTSHTRAWHLLHGRIEHFNSETIIDMLWRFGIDVDVTVVQQVPYARLSITPTGGRRWYPRGDFDYGPPYAPTPPRHPDGSPRVAPSASMPESTTSTAAAVPTSHSRG